MKISFWIKIKNNWQPLILGVFSFVTRFLFLSHPAEAVFDETAFGSFVKQYFTHQYYFDIHPPLGKLMIYFFAKFFGLSDYTSFSKIGQVASSQEFLILRFLPAFFGALFVLLIYYLILKIGLSKKAAFLGGLMVLCDNAILVQSKFILIDIFLLFFGFLSLCVVLCFNDSPQGSKKSYWFLVLASTFGCLSTSIKWTGLSFLALVFLFFIFDSFRKFNFKRVAINFFIIVIFPFTIYFSVFAVHFYLLTKPGTGDAFMSVAFQQNINHELDAPRINLWDEFLDLNQKMYFYNSTLKATHPYSSKWYQWPLDKRPIWYWSEQAGNKISNIFLIGNPIIWWSVLFSVLMSCGLLFFKFFRKKVSWIFYVLILGYFINILPFILVTRVAFLYHYFSSLIFGILILVYLYDIFIQPKKGFSAKIFYWVFIFLVVSCFLIISPVSYGIALPLNVSRFYNVLVNFFL